MGCARNDGQKRGGDQNTLEGQGERGMWYRTTGENERPLKTPQASQSPCIYLAGTAVGVSSGGVTGHMNEGGNISLREKVQREGESVTRRVRE